MIMMLEPKKMVLRLPSLSPTTMVKRAPKKHPKLYEATVIPKVEYSAQHNLASDGGDFTLISRDRVTSSRVFDVIVIDLRELSFE